MRPDGRAPDELRPLHFERDFTDMAEGSVLVSFGRTILHAPDAVGSVTSGGTESNAQGLASALAAGCERLIVSATEHPCVAEAARATGTARVFATVLDADDRLVRGAEPAGEGDPERALGKLPRLLLVQARLPFALQQRLAFHVRGGQRSQRPVRAPEACVHAVATGMHRSARRRGTDR